MLRHRGSNRLGKEKGMFALLKGFHTMAIYVCYWSDLEGQ